MDRRLYRLPEVGRARRWIVLGLLWMPGMLVMSARGGLRGPVSSGDGLAGQAAHRPARGRPEIPGLPGRRPGPSPVRGEVAAAAHGVG